MYSRVWNIISFEFNKLTLKRKYIFLNLKFLNFYIYPNLENDYLYLSQGWCAKMCERCQEGKSDISPQSTCAYCQNCTSSLVTASAGNPLNIFSCQHC